MRKSLQKFYARTLGERSYGIAEAVHLGLGLPLVIPMLPVVSVNTFGARRLKTVEEMKGADAAAPVAWDSKVDKFDKRLALVRAQFARARAGICEQWEADVRDVSLYEFYYKYNVSRNRLYLSKAAAAIMVTPSISADCANVEHPRHAHWARMCVVAFWRMLATSKRYELMDLVADAQKDRRRWGGSWFEHPAVHAGGDRCLLDRYLGVRDLMAFDEGKREEVRWSIADDGNWCFKVYRRKRGSWPYGWPMAVMEMLVDPLLNQWVPAWIVEQYCRWNVGFMKHVQKVLDDDEVRRLSNRQVLHAVSKRLLRSAQRRRDLNRDDADVGEPCSSDGGSGVSSCRTEDEVQQQEALEAAVMQSEELPAAGSGAAVVVGTEVGAEHCSTERALSACGPAPAAAADVGWRVVALS